MQIMWYRWYDAIVGQFLNRDPIGYDGGDWGRFYGYVANNPVMWRDARGLYRCTGIDSSPWWRCANKTCTCCLESRTGQCYGDCSGVYYWSGSGANLRLSPCWKVQKPPSPPPGPPSSGGGSDNPTAEGEKSILMTLLQEIMNDTCHPSGAEVVQTLSQLQSLQKCTKAVSDLGELKDAIDRFDSDRNFSNCQDICYYFFNIFIDCFGAVNGDVGNFYTDTFPTKCHVDCGKF